MNKVITFCLFAVLIVSLLAIGALMFNDNSPSDPADTETETYTNPEHGFSFNFPGDYIIDQQPIFGNEDRGGVEVSIKTSRSAQPPHLTLQVTNSKLMDVVDLADGQDTNALTICDQSAREFTLNSPSQSRQATTFKNNGLLFYLHSVEAATDDTALRDYEIVRNSLSCS